MVDHDKHSELRWRALAETRCDDDSDDAAFDRLMQLAVATSASSAGQRDARALRLLPPGTLVGERYVVERLLGTGGMGVVFAGRDRKMGGKPVAIKWLRTEPSHASVTRRFMREALAAGPIVHPHVVSIFDLGFHEDRPYLVMELLEGEPLSTRITRGPFEVPETVAIAAGILRGVAAAHARGIVHRDLKPGNVFLCSTGDQAAVIPKVLDFGIAKLSAETFGRLTLTDPDLRLGTPHYMAPEVIRGEAVDARTDLYSIAVMLYVMTTGRLPFDAHSEYELYRRILQGDRTPIRTLRADLPAALARVIERGMEVDPRRRPASAEAMLSELTGGARAAQRDALRPLAFGAGCALLLGLLVTLLLLREPPPAPPLPRLPVPAPTQAVPADDGTY